MKRKQEAIFSTLENLEIEPTPAKKGLEPQSGDPEAPVASEAQGLDPVEVSHVEEKAGVPADFSKEEPKTIPAEEKPAEPSPIWGLSAPHHDFGGVRLRDSKDWELMVSNEGEGEGVLENLEGLPANGFAVLDPPSLPLSVPPHSARSFKIRFAPDSEGKKFATLRLLAKDSGDDSFKILLAGAAVKVVQTPEGIYHSPIFNSLGMSFAFIPAGQFMMGSPEYEPGRNPDERQHQVTLTRGFYLQTTPVTQGQWQALMEDNPLFLTSSLEDWPVEGVSWRDCQEFIKKLNALGEGPYRLPTEAEWEYACRAGSSTAFANEEIVTRFSDLDLNLDRIGWFFGNSERHSHPVAQKGPNAWGLYDMHGNIYEWCQDWYGEYPPGPETDPQGAAAGTRKVARGGSWFSNAKNCRSAGRFHWPPGSRSNLQVMGFRLLREL